MSGGGGLSKLGIVLTVVFGISLLALLAELFYVLWRRRVFLRQANTVRGDDEVSRHSSSESTFSSVSSSKELLYFFCVRPQFCLQQESPAAHDTRVNDLNSNQQSDVEVIDIDLLKVQGMFGPPRFLFTIKEEEREDLESPAAKSMCPVAEGEVRERNIDGESRTTVSLEECFKAAEEAETVVEIDDGGAYDRTPFSTPCASPVYFTPSASPIHE